jgi:hypothetical protein
MIQANRTRMVTLAFDDTHVDRSTEAMLTDPQAPDHHDIDTTRATARLPGLDIEIRHHRAPGRDGEQISINLQAVPSFEAFGRLFESATPFAFWALAAQLAWLPWLAAFQAAAQFPGLAPPGSGSGTAGAPRATERLDHSR